MGSEIHQIGLLRLNQVLTIFPVSKSTWWAGCKTGKYPKPVKHGGTTFWKFSDIRSLIDSIEKEAA